MSKITNYIRCEKKETAILLRCIPASVVTLFVVFAPVFWSGFSWTVLQCAMCALTGALAELIMEILFSPIGYRIIEKWKTHNVGKEYLDYISRGGN